MHLAEISLQLIKPRAYAMGSHILSKLFSLPPWFKNGSLKQILIDSGVSNYIGSLLEGSLVSPLILAWLIATVIRVCVGSATVAGLTAAGIVLPLISNTDVSPELMVLAIGSGSLMLSHVNDAGFWLFKEYFNLTVKETLSTWTVMETIVGITGLIGVLILNIFI